MTTITINERTKAGKTLLDLARMLSESNKGVSVNVELRKPVAKLKELTSKQKALLSRLKKVKQDVDTGAYKGMSAQTFIDEL